MGNCALYGKLETEADFVRIGQGLEAEIALQRWLKAGVERSRGHVPEVAVRFLRRVAPAGELWGGVWVPSRDAVGREFPLAIFAPASAEVDQLPLSCLPAGLSRFAEEAEGVLWGLTRSHPSIAQEACSRLSPMHASELPHAWGRCLERAEGRNLREFAQAVFGPTDADQMFYALHTLRVAGAANPRPSLSFPLTDAEDAFVWLELLEAACPGASPDLFWSSGPDARLLASFSDDDSLFGSIWTEDGGDRDIWPVSTRQPAAVAEARDSLSPPERSQFDSELPLSSCLPSLGGRA